MIDRDGLTARNWKLPREQLMIIPLKLISSLGWKWYMDQLVR